MTAEEKKTWLATLKARSHRGLIRECKLRQEEVERLERMIEAYEKIHLECKNRKSGACNLDEPVRLHD